MTVDSQTAPQTQV